jgi:predicted MPP superfamily phosphohydrolase
VINVPAVLLAHSPDIVVDRDVSRFVLVLAGHTHGGQIRLPVLGPLRTQTRTGAFVEGLYRLQHGGWLHVSGGVGTSELPVRLLVPPSITVIELT